MAVADYMHFEDPIEGETSSTHLCFVSFIRKAYWWGKTVVKVLGRRPSGVMGKEMLWHEGSFR